MSKFYTIFAVSFGGLHNVCEPFTTSLSTDQFSPDSDPKDVMDHLLSKRTPDLDASYFDELYLVDGEGAHSVWIGQNDGYEVVGVDDDNDDEEE